MRNMFCGFLLLLAAALTGCEPAGSSSSVSITGGEAAAIGQTLTATSAGSGFTGDFRWFSAAAETAAIADRTEITADVGGTEKNTLTLTDPALAGQWIWVKRTDASGDVWSVPVQVEAAAAPAVNITGTPAVGQTLIAAATPESAFTGSGDFRWFFAASETAAEADRTEITANIDGTDKNTLTLNDTALADQWIWAERTDSSGNVVRSTPVQVTEPASPVVKVTGTPKIGQTLTATSEGGNFTGDFIWGYADTPGAPPEDFTPLAADSGSENGNALTLTDPTLVGKYVKALRKIADSTESAYSDPVEVLSSANLKARPQPNANKYLSAATASGTQTSKPSLDGSYRGYADAGMSGGW